MKARCYSYSQWFRQGLTEVRNLVMMCKEEEREMGASKSAQNGNGLWRVLPGRDRKVMKAL